MRNFVLFTCVFGLAYITSCNSDIKVKDSFSGFIQGTTYSIIYYHNGKENPEELKTEVEDLLAAFDMSLSIYNPNSIISKVNNNQQTRLDSKFIFVFKKSREIYDITDGAFDITAGPLISAWGFGPDAIKKFNEKMKDSLMHLVGMNRIAIVNGKVVKESPGMRLDVNAIAQGYSVDVICSLFEEKGFESYLVEIGGEVRCKGEKEGGVPWLIGLDKPQDGNMEPGKHRQANIRLLDKSLATSGNYRKFYIENGVKYSHTINPKTGYPVRHNLLSATIIADDCISADAFATACMVLGLSEAQKLIEANKYLEAYFVYSDKEGNFRTWITDGMMAYIED